RMAAKGDWNGGASLIEGVDPARAPLWREAARLHSDQSAGGLLAWARFLKKNDGKLFYKPDTVWYRSLFSRLAGLEYAQKEGASLSAELKPDANLPWTPE